MSLTIAQLHGWLNCVGKDLGHMWRNTARLDEFWTGGWDAENHLEPLGNDGPQTNNLRVLVVGQLFGGQTQSSNSGGSCVGSFGYNNFWSVCSSGSNSFSGAPIINQSTSVSVSLKT